MLPDTGERYLSTPLFSEISTDMTAEELEIMRSTPSAQFGGPAPTPAAAPPQAVPVSAARADDENAQDFLERTVAADPVVLFALEWCEFCWSLRNFLEAQAIPYSVIEIDAVPMQADQMGLRVRQALAAKTGSPTIPQLFIGGTFVGGCTDVFDAYLDGSLQTRLKAAGVTIKETPGLDPRDLLPKWLHPRLETAS